MTHVIFDLCIRDGACAEVCPVECIVPGEPEAEWPWFYIDPDTCIDCGACVPECPVDAIRPEEDMEAEFPQYVGAIRRTTSSSRQALVPERSSHLVSILRLRRPLPRQGPIFGICCGVFLERQLRNGR